jgi:hypothetical protein
VATAGSEAQTVQPEPMARTRLPRMWETQQQESAYRRTESTTPLGEDTPPMVAVVGQSPSASELGTWIATW